MRSKIELTRLQEAKPPLFSVRTVPVKEAFCGDPDTDQDPLDRPPITPSRTTTTDERGKRCLDGEEESELGELETFEGF